MSSTYSSVRSSPIPDLAYDSYRSLAALRDQALTKRHVGGGVGTLEGTPPPSSSPHQALYQQYREPYQPEEEDDPMRMQMPSAYPQHHGHSPRPHQQHQHQQKMNPTLQHHLMKMSRNPYDYVTCQGATYALSPYSGETLLFWILLGVLVILVIVNLTLTIVIFGTLRLGVGMESMEVFPNMLKFFGDTDLDEVYKRDGVIEGFANDPMSLETIGDNAGQVHLWAHDGHQPSLSIEKNGINISQVEEFKIMDDADGTIFTTTNPTLNFPGGMKNFDVKIVRANRITSDVNSTLELVSTRYTTLKGSEGTRMEGKEIQWTADRDILLKSNDRIILSGQDGISIYRYSLPLVDKHGVTRNFYTLQTHGKKESQFKLCICMPEGKLFRVEIPIGNNQHKHRSARRIGCHSAAANLC